MTSFRSIPSQGFVLICPRCLTENDKSDLIRQTGRQIRRTTNVLVVARCAGCELEMPLKLTLPEGNIETVDVDPYRDVAAVTIGSEEIPFVEEPRTEAEANHAYQNGEAAFEREDYLQAYACWRAAREWHETRSEGWINAAILSNMGMALSRLRAPTMALPCFEDALHIMDMQVDSDAYATVLNNVGFAYVHLGQMREAEKYHRRAYELRRECGSSETLIARDRHNLAFTYAKLASRNAVSGELDMAIRSARQAVALYDEQDFTSDGRSYIVMLGNLLRRNGDVAVRADRPVEAIELYREALAVHEQAGINAELLVAGYDRLAHLERDLGLLDQSLLTMQRSDALAERVMHKSAPLVLMKKRKPIATRLTQARAWLRSVFTRQKGRQEISR